MYVVANGGPLNDVIGEVLTYIILGLPSIVPDIATEVFGFAMKISRLRDRTESLGSDIRVRFTVGYRRQGLRDRVERLRHRNQDSPASASGSDSTVR